MTTTLTDSGLVVVDKPEGITSHGVVARVRRTLGTRKVGHAGTLDPMATGVLVLGINRATRLLGHLMLTDKAYDATIRLGLTTTTDDREGEPLAHAPRAAVDALTDDAVGAALRRFVGDIEQVPTAVSAIKVDGRRAYQRVRDGEEIRLAARPVTVHGIDAHELRRVEVGDAMYVDLDVSVRCSSGTYVRAIARDLGAALGVGGHLAALRRTAVGPFDVGAATALDDVSVDALVPLIDAVRASFPVLELDARRSADVSFGRRIDVEVAGLTALVGDDGTFLALYEPAGPPGSGARPVAVFA